MSQTEEPKFKQVAEGARDLSLGISMVVAVVIGVGIGLVLKNLTGVDWTLWVGVFIGISAAILNVYKVYEKQKKSLDELADDPRYTYKQEQLDKKNAKYDAEDEDDKY